MKKIKLYASLLAPPSWALRSMAAWRASQKLYRDEKTDPSLWFAVAVMRSTPAELASGRRSRQLIDKDLGGQRVHKEIDWDIKDDKPVGNEDAIKSLDLSISGNDINYSHMKGLLHKYGIFTTEVVAVIRYISKTS